MFGVAAQMVDRATAEEIVQEVFLAVWRKAETFDPERGTFRSWVLQTAHFRILNELRQRGRRPQVQPDPDGLQLAALPAADPEPPEVVWSEYRRHAVRTAMEKLPAAQRQALGLAFFEDLTHEQVAGVLHLPLGTAKTRIRAGLQKLRGSLAPVMAAVLVGSVALLGLRYHAEQATVDRTAQALALVTASDAEALRLEPTAGAPEPTHGHYTDRAGTSMAVLTLSYFPPAPEGKTYQGWARYRDTWRSLGAAVPDANGHALVIAEGADLAEPPDAVQVTLEPSGGSRSPSGPAIVAWSRN